VSAALLGRRLLREPSQQGCHGGDALDYPGEARGTLIFFKDPPVYVAGGNARAASIPTAPNLSLEFGTLLFYLETCLLELLLRLQQLLEPRGRWGLVSLPGPIVRAT
jgi:hypothetical protein